MGTKKSEPKSVIYARKMGLQDCVKLVKKINKDLLKVYDHPGFPTSRYNGLSLERLMRNIKLDPDDVVMNKLVSICWHELADEGKVPHHGFFRPPKMTSKLPF